ncbi:hypothetical protein [Flavobacterium algicola]|uniref:hypothetical protein n=1 Tax=Flavobacterium algicola TaxID=556529 RepID=UPI001EFDB2E3|nr:hypothetical protein [Flavobacterium algicola]MCG9791563.1 hypothetical protein [Flavobacterium algicola]
MKRFLLLFGIVLVALTIASNTKNEAKKTKKVSTTQNVQANKAATNTVAISVKK